MESVCVGRCFRNDNLIRCDCSERWCFDSSAIRVKFPFYLVGSSFHFYTSCKFNEIRYDFFFFFLLQWKIHLRHHFIAYKMALRLISSNTHTYKSRNNKKNIFFSVYSLETKSSNSLDLFVWYKRITIRPIDKRKNKKKMHACRFFSLSGREKKMNKLD